MEQNQQTKRKKIIVIALLVLTILLGAVAVFISYYIQQNQSPESSSADAACDTADQCFTFELANSIQCQKSGATKNCCPAGTQIDNSIRACISACNVKNNNCTPVTTPLSGSTRCYFADQIYNCCPGTQIAQNGTCVDGSSSSATCPFGTSINSSKTLCVCDNNSTFTYPIGTVSANCPKSCSDAGGSCQTSACKTGQTTVTNGVCNGGGFCCSGTATSTDTQNPDTQTPGGQVSGSCGNGGSCFLQGGSFNGVTVNNCGSVGRVDSSPNSCGAGYLCCSLTNSGSSSSGNSNNGATTTTKSQCGGTCNTSSDCAASATGVTVTCRNGVCENASCTVGKTVPGANCECSTLNACGQACSASLGLCQSGSECGFIGSPTSCVQNEGLNNGTQFCLPQNPSKGYTLTSCTGLSALNLRSPLGTNVTSQAQVLEACNLITQSSGVGSSGQSSASVCGDSVCSANESSFTCPGDCTLPDTAIVSDRFDRVIIGIFVIILGISLAGGFDKLRRVVK